MNKAVLLPILVVCSACDARQSLDVDDLCRIAVPENIEGSLIDGNKIASAFRVGAAGYRSLLTIEDGFALDVQENYPEMILEYTGFRNGFDTYYFSHSEYEYVDKYFSVSVQISPDSQLTITGFSDHDLEMILESIDCESTRAGPMANGFKYIDFER